MSDQTWARDVAAGARPAFSRAASSPFRASWAAPPRIPASRSDSAAVDPGSSSPLARFTCSFASESLVSASASFVVASARVCWAETSRISRRVRRFSSSGGSVSRPSAGRASWRINCSIMPAQTSAEE